MKLKLCHCSNFSLILVVFALIKVEESLLNYALLWQSAFVPIASVPVVDECYLPLDTELILWVTSLLSVCFPKCPFMNKPARENELLCGLCMKKKMILFVESQEIIYNIM